MAFWLRIGVVYNGVLSFMDIALFSYYAFVFKGSALELGVISAAWSIVYILANLTLGGLADRGSNKTLAFISMASSILMMIAFSMHTKLWVSIAYMLHALATTSISLALSVSVLELIDSYSWNTANAMLRIGTYASRGLLLIAFSYTLGTKGLSPYMYLSVAMGILTFISLPSIGLAIERKLYRFTRAIDELVHKASSWALFSVSSMNPSAIQLIEKTGHESRNGLSPGRILLAILLVVALGDYVFVVFTSLLATKLAYTSYLIFMGAVAFIIGPLMYLIGKLWLGSRVPVALLVMFRGLFFILFLERVDTPLEGAVFMLVSSTLYAIIELLLYSMYIQETTGYRTNMFFVSRETGSIIGSLLGGYLWRNAQGLYIPLAVIILVATLLSLVGGRKAEL